MHYKAQYERIESCRRGLRATGKLGGVYWSGSMVDRKYLDITRADSVNQTVVTKNDLSKVGVAQFRHRSPRAGKVRQPISGIKGSLSNYCRKGRRVAGYEQADRLQIVEGLKRPSYLSHFAMRRRASS